jgi:hypothetical protein
MAEYPLKTTFPRKVDVRQAFGREIICRIFNTIMAEVIGRIGSCAEPTIGQLNGEW